MVSPPKFPHNCDKEYTLTPEARNKFTECNNVLTMPVRSFGDLQHRIDCITENELMKGNPEEIYNDIKSAIYKIMNNKDQWRVCDYFSFRKTKDSFIKEYKRTMDENEPRVNKRKITKEREEAYENAQRLGNALTMRGLSEFQDQCIGSTTKEEAATQVSTTTRDEATQASITVKTSTYTTPTKKIT
ncbi:hypothetical protein CU098_009840 [Rhizopus stolonifer]|uniref:Uncharacterized protein n=1 Tax=Rhizopus stolonifer TaxID=4846 RepID=A0A367KPB0_RHIST|nr:hypothetical protein CU098_009840 [Rhizopus stolonifer]